MKNNSLFTLLRIKSKSERNLNNIIHIIYKMIKLLYIKKFTHIGIYFSNSKDK